MTVREIQGLPQEQYGNEVSPGFISSIIDRVMTEVTAWPAHPLEPMYPVVFFDALLVKASSDPSTPPRNSQEFRVNMPATCKSYNTVLAVAPYCISVC